MNRSTNDLVLRLSTILTGLLLAAWPAGASPSAILHLEPSDTSVAFALETTFHQTHGSMAVTEGEIRYDPATGALTGRVVVDATSAETGNKKRDRKMHKEVLESGRYPQIVFLPRRFEGRLVSGTESEILITGSIEIHGSRHEVEIPARILATEGAISGTGRFVVPYVEWGMEDPSFMMFRAHKEVWIDMKFSGHVDATDASWLSEPARAAN